MLLVLSYMAKCENNIRCLQPTTTKPPLSTTTLLMQNPYTTPFNETLKAGFADLRDAPRTQNLPLNQPPLSKQVMSILPPPADSSNSSSSVQPQIWYKPHHHGCC